MEKKNSILNAMMKRGASLFLVIALLITSVTLPEIDWQKGEATTVHGTLESSTPVFLWEADSAANTVYSNNISVSYGYDESEIAGYFKVANSTGTGVNFTTPYIDSEGVKATKAGTVANPANTSISYNIAVGDEFSVDIYNNLGNGGEAYANLFEKIWFNTQPDGITGIKSGSSYASVDYSGISNYGEGLLYLGDVNDGNELNWIPPQYSGSDGTRYAYFLVKYKATDYIPRMRVWAYGDQTGSNGVYQQNRVSDEGFAACRRNISNTDALVSEQDVVYSERDFFIGDGNIQYQLIWVDVVNGGGLGVELDSFALEINGADVNDFGWAGATADEIAARQAELAGEDLLIYEVAGFNSENDALAYMYRDIWEHGGKFTEKAYRTETLINAPQKVAIGDTVKAHTNNLIPGAVLDRGLYMSTSFDANGDRTGVSVLDNVSYLSSVYKTEGGYATQSPEDISSSHASGHVTTGNSGYIETLTYRVDSFTATNGAKYYYRVGLGDTSGLYSGTTRTGTVDLSTPLEIVKYENDPSLSAISKYTYGKEGHTYYQYDMDYAYMDALYEDGVLQDSWSLENFIYYLRAYNDAAEHLHEDDPDQINTLPGYFHTSYGSMTYDLGPCISDNYESVDFTYNNKTGGDVTLTLYVTTYESIEKANAGEAIGTKTYTETVSTSGRGVVTFVIPKYETAEQLDETNCGESSYVQNYAIRVETTSKDAEHTTTFDINNIVFAKRHTVEVAFKNEVDRDEHNAWDFNNKAIGVSHETIVKTTECGDDAHSGSKGTVVKDNNGNVLSDTTNNIYYNIENLACDACCQFITYDSGVPTVHTGSEKVSVYAVQQSDYNFAYNINIGTVSGVDSTNTNNKLVADVGHINYGFSMFANTVININVKWQNYANNIMAGMGVIGSDGKVDILDISSIDKTTTDSGSLTTYTAGTGVGGSYATVTTEGYKAPVITGVDYSKDTTKASYYADGTVTVELDPYNGGIATDIYMYYGDANGTPLTDYMHLQRQPVTKYAKVVSFDMVSNTVIPAGAETLVIEARNMTGATENSRSARYMIKLSSAGCEPITAANLGAPAYAVQVVSDTHIGKRNQLENTTSTEDRFIMMLNDVLKYEYLEKSHGIVIDGDLVNNEQAAIGQKGYNDDLTTAQQYELLLSLYNSVKTTNSKLPDMYWTIGNHDMGLGWSTADAYLSEFYSATQKSDYVQDITNKPYYYAKVAASDGNPGALYIYLGDESGDKESGEGVDGVITSTQIAWLRDVLATQHVDGMPIFVFFHEAVYDTVAGSLPGQGWDGIINHGQYDEIELQLMSILSSYEEAIFFSGHSHWDLNSPGTYYQESDMMCDAFNTGSVGYLWSSYGDTYTDGDHYENYESVGGSQGYYVEVYADGTVLVRGRDYQAGQWLPSAYFIVENQEDDSSSIYTYNDWGGNKGSYDREYDWILELNKASYEYGEKIIVSGQGIDKGNTQFYGIVDSNGTLVQSGYLLRGSSDGSDYNGETNSDGNLAIYPLTFSSELVLSAPSSRQDYVPGRTYNHTGKKLLPPGTYYVAALSEAMCDDGVISEDERNWLQCLQFTVTGTGERELYDMDITIEKDTYKYGEAITVGFGNVYNVSTETWIGIYSADDDVSTKNYKQYFSRNVSEGTIPFNDLSKNSNNGGSSYVYPWYKDGNVSYLAPGEYYVTAVGGADEYSQLSAPRVYFTVTPNDYSTDLAQTTYKRGENIVVNYIADGAMAGTVDVSAYDIYIGIWGNGRDGGSTSTSTGMWYYQKIDRGAGSVSFPMLSSMSAASGYYVGLFAGPNGEAWCNNGTSQSPLSSFAISDEDLNPQVSVSKDSYLNGEDITVSYSDISGTKPRVAIYDASVEDPKTAISKAWAYVSGSGTWTLACPETYLANGDYYAIVIDGETPEEYTALTDKAPFSVVSNDFSVSVSQTTAKPGDTITINYTANGVYSGGTDSIDVSGYNTFYIGIWNGTVGYDIAVERGSGTATFTVPSDASEGSYYVGIFYSAGRNGWCTHTDGRNPLANITITAAYPTLTVNTSNATVDSNGNITFVEGENITVNYEGSVNPYQIAIMTADDNVIRQVAYTAVNGSIKFNNGGTTDVLDQTAVNGVHFTSDEYVSLPVGDYKIVTLDGSGNVITTDDDVIYFSIAEREVLIRFTDSAETTATFVFNEPVSIDYEGSTKGYLIGLFSADTESYDNAYDALQVAYTSDSGTIVFNNYYTDEYDNRVNLLDSSDYDVVSSIGQKNLFIGAGEYYVQAFKMVGGVAQAVTGKLEFTIGVDENNKPGIEPEIPSKKYTYVNNEAVGVNYTGAGWGYWLAVYNKADAGYSEDGTATNAITGEKYNPLTAQNPFKDNGEEVTAVMRAWINGNDQLVEFNNALNFSGSMDTGTTGDLPMLPQHWNGVLYVNDNIIALGSQTEVNYYTVIMFDEQHNEVDRFDITVVPPGYETDEDTDIEEGETVVGYIGQWISEAGGILIEVEEGDKDTNVIEYSTKKTFTASANTAAGYKFVGWYDLAPDGTVRNLISDDEVLTYYNFYVNTITIYALFVKLDDVNSTIYDVNFYNDAGQIVQSVPVVSGGAVDISNLVYTNPVKVGYTFAGWSLPSATTAGATPVYYTTNLAEDGTVAYLDSNITTNEADARFYVVKGDGYDMVYKMLVDENNNPVDEAGNEVTDGNYVWNALAMINVTSNVKVIGLWGPASGTTASTKASITITSYDSDGAVETGTVEIAINKSVRVTTGNIAGKTFIGWVDLDKDLKQSYTIDNTSDAVSIEGLKNTGDSAITIYSNGTVNVNGVYHPIISYSQSYAFRIVGNMNLRAIYADGEFDLGDNAKPAVTISRYVQFAERGDTKVNATVNAIVTMPTDNTNYEFVEFGYLYYMAAANDAPTTVFYDEDGNATTANFLSFATVATNASSKFIKKPINTEHVAGQYFGSVNTTVETGKKLYVRPYLIYTSATIDGSGVTAENANYTIAYGETLVIDMSTVLNTDALEGDSKLQLYEETLLTAGTCVNYKEPETNSN